MSTDDIGGPATPDQVSAFRVSDPVALAVRMDKLGLNQGNHEPPAAGAVFIGDLRGSAPPQTPEQRVLEGELDATPGDYWCKRCGRDEIDARANGCPQGPCPMEPKRPVLFIAGQAIVLDTYNPPEVIRGYHSLTGELVWVRHSRLHGALRPFVPILLFGLGLLAVIGVLAIARGPV